MGETDTAGAARGALTIGFLIDRWEPRRGGAERAMADLATHLLRSGHRVRVFAERADPGAPGEFTRVAGRGWTRASRARWLAAALPHAAEAAACDVTLGVRQLRRVDLYWPHDGAHAVSLAARREARGRAPDAPPRGRHELFIALERQLLEEGGARRVVCVSQLVRDELERLYPPSRERLVLIENGVDLQRFTPQRRAQLGPALRARLGIAAEAPLIAFAGADARRKGLPELLSALASLRTRPWTLLAAGVHRAPSWRRAARRAGLGAERVHFAPLLDAAELWAAADLCALPTWRDTSGLVVLEALASGVAVVTTRRAGASAYLTDSRAGQVIERPDDTLALTAALSSALDRIERGEHPGPLARACVAHLDQGAWLRRMEAELVALVGARA